MANYYEFPLQAGIRYNAGVRGSLILIDYISGADTVDVIPVKNGSEGRTMKSRKTAFKVWVDYDDVIFVASADCTLGVFLSDKDVSLGFTSGQSTVVSGSVSVSNDAGHPVPVDLISGTVNVTASSVTISNNDAAAIPVRPQALATIIDIPAVTVGTGAVSVSNDATLRKLAFRNTSTTQQITLGSATVTTDGPIVLQPGDIYIEDDAAGAHWYAVADAAGATLTMQGKK